MRSWWLLALLALGGLAFGSCRDPATAIHEVQGDGRSSPLAGEPVVVEGVVVGDFQGADALEGFYVQEEDGERDDDPATSEGIFVFEGPTPVEDIDTGDTVRVAGTVTEFFDLTELTDVTSVVVCASGATVRPTVLELPLTEDRLEQVENMLSVLPQELVISDYADFDRFGEVVLALPLGELDRPYQPTAYLAPGRAEAAAAAMAARRITLDDGRGIENPHPPRHPGGGAFTLGHRFRGGDTLANTRGVLTYAFGRYRLQPTDGADFASVHARPAEPDPVGGSVRVASFNVLNFFVTLGRRGAQDADELVRQRAKLVAALARLDADVLGLVEIENDDRALDHLVSALNEHVGAGSYDFVRTGPLGLDEIKVALVYRTSAVTPAGGHAVFDAAAFVDPAGSGRPRNRPALAQTFEQSASGAAFTVVVNHLKSKGSSCGRGDDHPVQGNCNLTRTLAVQELLDWLGGDPTGAGDRDVLIVGDLNAYDEEDPIAAFAEHGYVDLGEAFRGEFAYTYVSGGRFGHLDYAMASPTLVEQVTGTTHWHINADEPDLLDYRTRHKTKAQQEELFEPDPFRSSDHDPVIVGLELEAPDAAVPEP